MYVSLNIYYYITEQYICLNSDIFTDHDVNVPLLDTCDLEKGDSTEVMMMEPYVCGYALPLSALDSILIAVRTIASQSNKTMVNHGNTRSVSFLRISSILMRWS